MGFELITRRITIRSGEESVLCSTALLRRGSISADFWQWSVGVGDSGQISDQRGAHGFGQWPGIFCGLRVIDTD